MSRDLWSLAIFALAVPLAILADRAARSRRGDLGGERGDFWAFITRWICLVLGPALLVSGVLKLVPPVWNGGWHLLLDLTNAFGLTSTQRYLLALLIPFLLFVVLLGLGLITRPQPNAGRWLAGSVSFVDSRNWILLFALPLAAVLLIHHGDLHRGPNGYPAAVWSTHAVLLLCLWGVATSAGRPAPRGSRSRDDSSAAASSSRPAWPEAMASRGIRLEKLIAWEKSPAARPIRGATARDLSDRLVSAGARGVAPAMVEAIDGLLAPARSGEPERVTRLVFAPDDCGQVECTALASDLLRQRFQATTLVVTSQGSHALAARLRRQLGDEQAVQDLGVAGEVLQDTQIWVVDAEILSDRLLPRLTESAWVRKLGLVVWWQLESYTGVLGANLWAISRRLHRLILHRGRHDVRTLALMRSAPHGTAQPSDFVRRLLPHAFPDETIVHVERRFATAIHLYALASHDEYFARGHGRSIRDSWRRRVLVAAKASTEGGWQTSLEVPAEIAGASEFLQLGVGDRRLEEVLTQDNLTSEARLRGLTAGEVLSLLEMTCQGGRNLDGDSIHYVGVSPPLNPYARYVLGLLTDERREGAFDASRRLVCAEAHRSIFKRHLLLALNEQPDTRLGLRKNFLWQEEIIRDTLEQIAHEGKLTKKEVRFLDDADRLVIDYEYRSQALPAGERRPLDTVGARLIEVRDPAAGFEEQEGIRMRVDPERLTIRAYPHRVFVLDGRRYRIREWDSPEEVIRRGWVECKREDEDCRTWRLRNSFVYQMESVGKPVGIGRRGRLLTRTTVDLHYEEEILGAINQSRHPTSGWKSDPETLRTYAINQSFPTRALVLRFPESPSALALISLCQALRHVLPVHLGIEEDALEMVALDGERIEQAEVYGVAIVDLYPGGIGLIDAIVEDGSLILEILERTSHWLAACACQEDTGCEDCLHSAASLAVNSDHPPSRTAALDLLSTIV